MDQDVRDFGIALPNSLRPKDSTDWIPLSRAARIILPMMSFDDGRNNFDCTKDKIINEVADGRVAGRKMTAAPTHKHLVGLELLSPQWFDVCFGDRDVWGGQPGPGYGDFYAEFRKWVHGDGLWVSRVDTEALILNLWTRSTEEIEVARGKVKWSFPEALAWIATRDIAEVDIAGLHFRIFGPGTAVHRNKDYNAQLISEIVGRLVAVTAAKHCACGQVPSDKQEGWEVCRCVGNAWDELVSFDGGLKHSTPRFDPKPGIGRYDLSWPEGADEIDFQVSEVQRRWDEQRLDQRAVQPGVFSDEERKQWMGNHSGLNADAALQDYRKHPRQDGTKQSEWRKEWSSVKGTRQGAQPKKLSKP